jgi:hypothetical protein
MSSEQETPAIEVTPAQTPPTDTATASATATDSVVAPAIQVPTEPASPRSPREKSPREDQTPVEFRTADTLARARQEERKSVSIKSWQQPKQEENAATITNKWQNVTQTPKEQQVTRLADAWQATQLRVCVECMCNIDQLMWI